MVASARLDRNAVRPLRSDHLSRGRPRLGPLRAEHPDSAFRDLTLAFARHAQAAKLEGIRIGLEAVIDACSKDPEAGGYDFGPGLDHAICIAKAIDPLTLAGDGAG